VAKAGDTVANPVTGERFVFRGVATSGSDDAFRTDVFARPFGRVASPHVHAAQDEHVEVLAGHLAYRLGRDEHPLGPRQTMTFPAGKTHVWWNDGDTEAHVVMELRPAAAADALVAELARLARDGKTDEHGMPGGIDLALLGVRFGFYAAGLPLATQRPLARALASLARVFGRRR